VDAVVVWMIDLPDMELEPLRIHQWNGALQGHLLTILVCSDDCDLAVRVRGRLVVTRLNHLTREKLPPHGNRRRRRRELRGKGLHRDTGRTAGECRRHL
jgi:hypothetical protein